MQFEGHDGVDLNSGCNFWTESFDAYGGAVVLLERRLVPGGRRHGGVRAQGLRSGPKGRLIGKRVISILLFIRLFDRLSTGSLPLALFVFVAESMRIGQTEEFQGVRMNELALTRCRTGSGCGTSVFLHGVRGLQLLDGVFRRERRRGGAAGVSTLSCLLATTVSTATRAATLRGSYST